MKKRIQKNRIPMDVMKILLFNDRRHNYNYNWRLITHWFLLKNSLKYYSNINQDVKNEIQQQLSAEKKYDLPSSFFFILHNIYYYYLLFFYLHKSVSSFLYRLLKLKQISIFYSFVSRAFISKCIFMTKKLNYYT